MGIGDWGLGRPRGRADAGDVRGRGHGDGRARGGHPRLRLQESARPGQRHRGPDVPLQHGERITESPRRHHRLRRGCDRRGESQQLPLFQGRGGRGEPFISSRN